jgi:hypothetical protein
MPALMGRLRLALLLGAVLALGCGNDIGDPCSISSDCAQDGSRTCDLQSPDGYCTIEACDFDTCPDEAVCVRFYPGLMSDDTCDQSAPDTCEIDEICTVTGLCAARATERRYCMLKCSGHGDCRDGYECRDRARMELHGGEPVPNPADESMSTPDQGFCAGRRPCLVDAECDDESFRCDGTYCVER